MLEASSINPDQLIQLLQSKSEKGFNYLYDNYSGALYGVILRIVSVERDANEILQDAFVKIWNAVDQYDSSKGSLYTWMLNITKNTAIDKLKSKGFQNSMKNQTLPDFVNNSSELSVEQKHHFNEIKKVIASLKEEHSVIIQKAYFEGMTQEEISKDLSIPLGTIKTRTRAAFTTLRQLLKEFKN